MPVPGLSGYGAPGGCGVPPPQSKRSDLKGHELDPVRSAAQLASARGKEQAEIRDKGFPIGPLGGGSFDINAADSDVKRFAADVSTVSGGFTIHRNGGEKPMGGRGPLAKWKCTAQGCPWFLKYEKTTDGWCVFSSNLEHNHELKVNAVAVAATSGGRIIPFEYDSLVRLLVAAAVPCETTMRVLRAKADMDGVTVNWLYEDVYNKYYRSAGHFGTQGFLDVLRKRRQESNLDFCLETLSDDSIHRVFVEMPQGKLLWGSTQDSSVPYGYQNSYVTDRILFIDPTCNTNKYGMKLSMFVTIDIDGFTRILGYLLHFSESHEDLFWGLRCFHDIFLDPPTVVFTDSGGGLLSAIDAFSRVDMPWHGTIHLLCIFHLNSNFYTNLRPLFRYEGGNEDWRSLHHLFWRLAKDSDWRLVGRINDGLVSQMRKMIHEKGTGNSKENGLRWFDTVFAVRRTQWEASVTWRHFTGGAHSTVRAEQNHSAFKKWSRAKSSLVDLDAQLSSFESQTEPIAEQSEMMSPMKMIKLTLANEPAPLKAIRKMKKSVIVETATCSKRLSKPGRKVSTKTPVKATVLNVTFRQ